MAWWNFISNLPRETDTAIKKASSNACRLSQRDMPKRTKSTIMRRENDPTPLAVQPPSYRRMAYIKYPFNGDLGERQKNRHRPISAIYDSRELPSVTNSRIKYGGWEETRAEEK